MKIQKMVIVCVSEGIHDGEGGILCECKAGRGTEAGGGTEAFDHKMLSGCGRILEDLVR